MNPRWTVRILSWLVPQTWRSAVVSDLEEEARATRSGSLWLARELLRVGLRMRVSFMADAALVDLRFVIRSFVREKGFTAAAVLTLVLGIGVNLVVFTVVDRVLFRPLPFADIDRLVMISQYDFVRQEHAAFFAKALFLEGRRLPSVADMAYGGFTSNHRIAREGEASPPLGLTEVSFNFLDVLGTRAVIGRGFTPEDAKTPGAAMVTYETWRDRFGGASSILGTELRSGANVRVIVGVLPPGFQPPVINRPSARFDGVFVLPDTLQAAGPRAGVWAAVARLSPGASGVGCQGQFDALSARLKADLGERSHRVLVEPLRPAMFWYGYRYLWLLAAAAVLVGLVACVNLSSLLLARGRSRAQETAVRAALGASLGRLLLTEFVRSLAVCVLASAISLVLIYWLTEGLRGLVPGYFRLLMLRGIDGRVVGFAALVVFCASVIAGGLPAWRATRTSLMAVIQRDGGLPAHARRNRAGEAVIAFQAGLGVVLVLAAAMVVRSFVGLVSTDTGFARANLHVVSVQPTGERRGGDDVAELARYRGILDMIRQQPGVESAGGSDSMPAAGAGPMTGFRVPPGGYIGLWQVTEGFLETIGVRTIAGRLVTAADVVNRQAVAVVSEAAGRRLWPGARPEAFVGREIVADGQPVRRVVGVVADIRDRPDRPAPPMVFAPVRAEGLWFLEFAVRTKKSLPPPAPESLRRALAGPFGVTSVRTDAAGYSVTSALEQPRIQAVMFGTFAVIALVLAALGLYAVTSFDVALRRYELGIRSALGASAAKIRRLVIVDAVRPVVAGTAIGLVVSYWISEWLEALVYQVDLHDPWTFGIAAATLLVTAALAAWLPARRASVADPAAVLRTH
jgi:putative ABC transport system permease protein